jgi:hypothetical protein
MNFYLITFIVGFFLLIMCLVGVGLLMQSQTASIKYPLHPNTCPDLWTLSSDSKKCNVGNTNVGNISASSISLSDMGSTTCDKKRWAKTNGIKWDGVSNYTGC